MPSNCHSDCSPEGETQAGMRKVTEDRIRKEHNSEGLGVLVFLEARGLSKEQLEI